MPTSSDAPPPSTVSKRWSAGRSSTKGKVNAARIVQLPQLATIDDAEHGLGTRVERGHVRLDKAATGGVGGREHRLGLDGVHAERLLAQHVLARLERRQHPGPVQAVGKRVVDDVHI